MGGGFRTQWLGCNGLIGLGMLAFVALAGLCAILLALFRPAPGAAPRDERPLD
jgi:hypothetical protein